MDEVKTAESCQALAVVLICFDNKSLETLYSAKRMYDEVMACRARRSGTVLFTLDALKRGLAASTCRQVYTEVIGKFWVSKSGDFMEFRSAMCYLVIINFNLLFFR